MIATRSAVRSTSLRMWLDRKVVRPLGLRLVDEGEERLLDERVEAGGRLVEDQELGPVLERDHQADLLLVPLRVLPEAPLRINVEALDQRRLEGLVDPAPQVSEILEGLATGQAVVEGELARNVADPAVDPDRVDARFDAEDKGSAARRADQVEDRADRGRLARAVRPEEAEHLALADLEVDIGDTEVAAVVLGELLGLDDGGHVCRGDYRAKSQVIAASTWIVLQKPM